MGKHVKPYINRELSWLEFNQRVLNQAVAKENPVLERAKFLAITASNLDEFFMIRVASLKDQVLAGYAKRDISGMTPSEQLTAISRRAHQMAEDQYRIYHDELISRLARRGVHILPYSKLKEEQLRFVDDYYKNDVYPILTPMAVDFSRPFPLLQSRSLNLGVILEGKEHPFAFATVQVPNRLPRLIRLPGEEGSYQFLMLEELIRSKISTLFSGRTVLSCSCYRITRNADLTLEEEEANDLLSAIEQQLKLRKWGTVIRLELEENCSPELYRILMENLELEESEIYPVPGPLHLGFLFSLSSLPIAPAKYTPYTPRLPRALSGEYTIFDAIREKDILLHHPFDSFQPVIDFVSQAADDPDVLAIKQTLYRVSGHSPIVAALSRAAENGKQVTVLLEVKARFDEENNIQWARRLEQAGCYVIYGLVGLKTHSKITLIVRREGEKLRRYLHLGTGNYNDETANTYTDFGLFTADKTMGRDATEFFNMISGYCVPREMKKLCAAPLMLRRRFTDLIDREISFAKAGKKARIFAKMNSLVDPGIIDKLYEASAAGVEISLLVRGICCLRAGMEGLSERIAVRSIVGRYLEHSRVYYFENGGKPELFLSSADWMPRNLDTRVELMFPIEDRDIFERILSIMDIYWRDNVKTSLMQPDGGYLPLTAKGAHRLAAHNRLMKKEK